MKKSLMLSLFVILPLSLSACVVHESGGGHRNKNRAQNTYYHKAPPARHNIYQPPNNRHKAPAQHHGYNKPNMNNPPMQHGNNNRPPRPPQHRR